MLLIFLIVGSFDVFGFDKSKHINKQHFADPPKEYRQHTWLTYDLSHATEEKLTKQIRQWAEQDLTGGFYLDLAGGNTTGLSDEYLKGAKREPSDEGFIFLSKEYFDLYAKAIDAGLKYGNPLLVFYDEVGYPSGMAGGFLYSKYPQHAAKSLEKVEQDFVGPLHVNIQIPVGITLGTVRMNLDTKVLVDISDKINNQQHLQCLVPEGRWKVMGFYLDSKASLGQGRKSGYVDYLDEEAIRAYISFRIHQTNWSTRK
jgi:hypothetical protein